MSKIWFASGFGAPYMARIVIDVVGDAPRKGFSYQEDGGLEILKRAWTEVKSKLEKTNETQGGMREARIYE